jgi:ABC-2 type transport system ATP-binding protein
MVRFLTAARSTHHPEHQGLTTVIRVKDLTKRYGDFTAVDGLSFEVEAGVILGLLGPNGAGKTTTLRSVTGIIPATSGSVSIAGHDLKKDPVAAKQEIAFIPDDPQFFEHLTVSEHLGFMARLYNVEDADEHGSALLQRLELEEKRDKLPSQLSRGMRQKLAIACALLHRPKVLFFDEPLTGLDPGGMRRMKATLKEEAAAGAAIVLSSHLLHLIEELASHVLVLAYGRMVSLGPIGEIGAHRPELEGQGLEDIFLALTSESNAADDLG